MKNTIKNTRFYGLIRWLRKDISRTRQKITRNDKKIINHYFIQHKLKKLHLGCGKNIIKGWLNSDISPKSNDVVYIDVTEPYPFDDETFDYVFSEHLIEHLSYIQGQNMLNECFRVLKYDGKIRITTPDLSFFISLYQSEKSEFQQKYIRWTMETYMNRVPYSEDTFVINSFVRDWGHKFIYDEKVLRFSLEKSGFKEVTKCKLNQSRDEVLKDLENEKRLPEGFLRRQSFTLEGIKK